MQGVGGGRRHAGDVHAPRRGMQDGRVILERRKEDATLLLAAERRAEEETLVPLEEER